MIHNHRSRVRIPLQMVPCFCERREQRLHILCYRNINWITGDCCRANIGEVKSLACIKKSASCIKASTAMKWYDLTAGTCRRQDTDFDFTGSIPGDALLIKMKGKPIYNFKASE